MNFSPIATIALSLSPAFTEATANAVLKEAELLRAEVRFVCSALAARHPAIEEKLGLSRPAFLERCLGKAQQVSSHSDFVTALNGLRASFSDGHMGWELSNTEPEERHLPITLQPREGNVVVARSAIASVARGETVLDFQGRPVDEAVRDEERCVRQSTPFSSRAHAARMLSLWSRNLPCGTRAEAVTLLLQRPDGTRHTETLSWKKESGPLTRRGFPSLENLPPEGAMRSENMWSYLLTQGGLRIGVLHPRAFQGWNDGELELHFEGLRKGNPDAILVDLVDSSGGSIFWVRLLANALGAVAPIETFETMRSGAGNGVEERATTFPPRLNPLWTGKTAFLVNSHCGSACDIFVAHMREMGRGPVLGSQTGGRGFDTTTLRLPIGRATFDLPIGEIFLGLGGGRRLRIEGNPILAETSCSGDVENCLKTWLEAREK